jgi:hypothetical protein
VLDPAPLIHHLRPVQSALCPRKQNSYPLAVFCWDFDDARIVAFREFLDTQSRPDDWFAWLGLERIGERIDP